MSQHLVNAQLELNRAMFLVNSKNDQKTKAQLGYTDHELSQRINECIEAAIIDLQKAKAQP